MRYDEIARWREDTERFDCWFMRNKMRIAWTPQDTAIMHAHIARARLEKSTPSLGSETE
jgi:hypothetical protein